jgi:hypothetical protein
MPSAAFLSGESDRNFDPEVSGTAVGNGALDLFPAVQTGAMGRGVSSGAMR